MRLVLPKRYEADFIFNYLPRIMYRLILGENKKGVFIKLNSYLKERLGINYSCLDIIKESINNSFKTSNSKEYIIDTYSTNIFKDTDYKINDLINLIEFGNLEIKGTQVFVKVFDLIRYSIEYLYRKYRIGGR